MSKVWNMILVLTGVTLLMKIAGIPTGLDWLFDFLGLTSSGFTGSQSGLWIKIGLLLAASVGVAVVVGFFTKASFEWMIVAPFATGTAYIFISTFVSIINYASNFDSWISYTMISIYGILGIGFMWGLLEWVFNRQ